jgi:ATP-dependent RNA helicase DeaD
VADLRTRRLELTRAALQESLDENDYEQFRVVVDNLSGDYDLMQIALAAVRLAHEASTPAAAEEDIPSVVAPPRERPAGRAAGSAAGRNTKPDRSAGAKPARARAGGPSATIFVGLGHAAKIRPQDLVGAIANESSVTGREIGAIEITHKFSTVEVPAAAADEVINALSATLIKGRKARVERYRPPAHRSSAPRRQDAGHDRDGRRRPTTGVRQ